MMIFFSQFDVINRLQHILLLHSIIQNLPLFVFCTIHLFFLLFFFSLPVIHGCICACYSWLHLCLLFMVASYFHVLFVQMSPLPVKKEILVFSSTSRISHHSLFLQIFPFSVFSTGSPFAALPNQEQANTQNYVPSLQDAHLQLQSHCRFSVSITRLPCG